MILTTVYGEVGPLRGLGQPYSSQATGDLGPKRIESFPVNDHDNTNTNSYIIYKGYEA